MGAIVIGYDASPGARTALSCAVDLAKQYGDDLVIANGVAPPGGVGEEWRATLAAVEDETRVLTQEALEEAARAGVNAEVELVPELPAAALVEVADRRDARFIVVGSWGESALRGAILGSTPHKLLQISERPVLVVPPGPA